MTNAAFDLTTSLDKTLGVTRWGFGLRLTSLFVLLVGLAAGLVACGDEAANESDSVDVAGIDEADGDTTPESPLLDPISGMPMIDGENVSSERKATLSAWMATQKAEGGEDFEAFMAEMASEPTVPAGGAGIPSGALSPGMSVPTILDDYGIEKETDYDPLALEAAIGLFRSQAGQADADIQNVGLHVITPFEFASLRDSTPMAMGRGSTGSTTDQHLWIAIFDTSEPLTAGAFLPENINELGDLGPESPLAGPDGLTTVYYILSLSNELSGGKFLAISKGVLNDQTSWTRADLENVDRD